MCRMMDPPLRLKMPGSPPSNLGPRFGPASPRPPLPIRKAVFAAMGVWGVEGGGRLNCSLESRSNYSNTLPLGSLQRGAVSAGSKRLPERLWVTSTR
jgi:hypothetical protein